METLLLKNKEIEELKKSLNNDQYQLISLQKEKNNMEVQLEQEISKHEVREFSMNFSFF